LKFSKFESLISFLQGAVLAATFVGAFFIFIEYYWISLQYTFSVITIYVIFCLIIVVFLEYILIKLNLLREAKKQTSLLEEIKEELKK